MQCILVKWQSNSVYNYTDHDKQVGLVNDYGHVHVRSLPISDMIIDLKPLESLIITIINNLKLSD